MFQASQAGVEEAPALEEARHFAGLFRGGLLIPLSVGLAGRREKRWEEGRHEEGRAMMELGACGDGLMRVSVTGSIISRVALRQSCKCPRSSGPPTLVCMVQPTDIDAMYTLHASPRMLGNALRALRTWLEEAPSGGYSYPRLWERRRRKGPGSCG